MHHILYPEINFEDMVGILCTVILEIKHRDWEGQWVNDEKSISL